MTIPSVLEVSDSLEKFFDDYLLLLWKSQNNAEPRISGTSDKFESFLQISSNTITYND